MFRLGFCGRCGEWRYLKLGFCPECQTVLIAWRESAAAELRAEILAEFCGELDKPEDELWKELGL